MNVEPKMFIRYGIPGWYLIISTLIVLRTFKIDVISATSFSIDIFTSVIVTVAGVPLGYVLYQIYFFLIHRKHKNSTPDWNVFVYSNVKTEDRDFVSGRYAHMLRGVHELGVLRVTLQMSIFGSVTLSWTV